jgi:non-haem Fe2+, alpha-ketoglutarate-dependent halogenase
METHMRKTLTQAQVESYWHNGFLTPIDVMTSDEAARYLHAFEEAERAAWGTAGNTHDDPEGREWLRRPHHFHRWAFNLTTTARLIDAVEDLLGPDIMLWDAKMFPKPPHSGSFVSWHQDATYVGLRPLDKVLTVWLALTDADEQNGCVQYLPGSHRLGQRPHAMKLADGNLLSRGQVVEYDTASQPAVSAVLRAGQMVAHHMHVVHGSLPNPSSRPRVGISINFVTPDVIETGEDPRPAVLLRGRDPYGHFAPLAVPP